MAGIEIVDSILPNDDVSFDADELADQINALTIQADAPDPLLWVRKGGAVYAAKNLALTKTIDEDRAETWEIIIDIE